MSHPMWVRGLKLLLILLSIPIHVSHPMWVRGLKQVVIYCNVVYLSRTPCGCVD